MASLYTRIARPCAPCPRHAHTGPRDHFHPQPPADPPEPVEAPAPRSRRRAEPMRTPVRESNYHWHNVLTGRAGRGLTVRQRRQLRRMARWWGEAWGEP